MHGKIITIGSMKGGVGKTVTVFNLAFALAELGKKVLAVDFDSQANLTTCFGVKNTAVLEKTIGHLVSAALEDQPMSEMAQCIRTRNGVDFIPSSVFLSAAEAQLRMEMGSEQILAEILMPLREQYDFILIDTCPSLGILTINALSAADEVIITVNPQLLAMMGLQDFLRTVSKIHRRLNPQLMVAGILMTMCDDRTNLCRVISEDVAETFRGQIPVFESRIPQTVKVGESVYYSEPLLEYSPESKACVAYQGLAKEVAYEG